MITRWRRGLIIGPKIIIAFTKSVGPTSDLAKFLLLLYVISSNTHA